jgi:hypothetical protein
MKRNPTRKNPKNASPKQKPAPQVYNSPRPKTRVVIEISDIQKELDRIIQTAEGEIRKTSRLLLAKDILVLVCLASWPLFLLTEARLLIFPVTVGIVFSICERVKDMVV